MTRTNSWYGTVAALWGLSGVLLLLLSATLRLTPKAIEAFAYTLGPVHWTALIAIVLGMAYMEGYKGFQKGFSPRVAARARYLREHPRLLHALLAPFFCMGYFHATQRRMITSISLTIGIIGLIIAVHFVAQPWRGIIDAGVVVGLAWGIISLLFYAAAAFRLERFPHSPDVPAERH